MAPLALALLVIVGTVLAGRWALSVHQWRVMTDEMTYLKAAQSFWETLSPIPRVRGVPVHNYSVLYPGLLAPLVGLFDVPTAFRLAHGLGALLMATAAVPAYLLAAFVSRSRAVALAAAAPVVLTPWLLFAMSLLTEVAAYPVFVWAVYASVVAVSEPSRKRDAMLLGALTLAFLTRTQFIVLFALIPLIILLLEIGSRLRDRRGAGRMRCVRAGARAAVTEHSLLWVVVLVGALVALLAPGQGLLGSYQSAVGGAAVFPPNFVQSLFDHLNTMLLGLAVLPWVMALAYVGETLGGSADRRERVLALHVLLIVPVLLVMVTNFDLRIAGSVNERYLFYIAPLLVIAAACYCKSARRPALAIGAATVATTLVLSRTTFIPTRDFALFGSPTRLSWVALDFRFGQVQDLIGISFANSVAVAGGAAIGALILVWLLRTGRRAVALAGFGIGLAVWGVALMTYCAPKVRTDHDGYSLVTFGAVPPSKGSDWIDRALPPGAIAAMAPSEINSRAGAVLPLGTVTAQGVWWHAEFWNKAVRRAYLYEGAVDYSALVSDPMRLDPRTGRLLVGGSEAPYLVVAKSEVRMAPEGVLVKGGRDLNLYKPRHPYRAAWAMRDASERGELSAAGARLVLYGNQASGRRMTTVALSLTAREGLRQPLEVSGPGLRRRVSVGKRRLLSLQACVPAGRSRTIRLEGKGLPKLRLVNVLVRRGAPC